MLPNVSAPLPHAKSAAEITPAAPPHVIQHPILGLRFNALNFSDTLSLLETWMDARSKARQIVLANAYTVTFCRQDPALQAQINTADMILADGMSIVWGGRLLGIKIPERIAGPDLMEKLCALAEKQGRSIFLMGSSPENLEQLQRVLLAKWPLLRIAGLHSPSMSERFDERETLEILKHLEAANPDILFVGVSAPKQEIWIAENLHRLPSTLNIGVGAAFDFMSGRIPRAPERLRATGFEWLYRLWHEPRRLWKRYLLGNTIFLSALTYARIKHRIKRTLR